MSSAGKKTHAQCISGICTVLQQNPNACEEICGKPSCSDAVPTEPCDLTNQLQNFTGTVEISLNGKTFNSVSSTETKFENLK